MKRSRRPEIWTSRQIRRVRHILVGYSEIWYLKVKTSCLQWKCLSQSNTRSLGILNKCIIIIPGLSKDDHEEHVTQICVWLLWLIWGISLSIFKNPHPCGIYQSQWRFGLSIMFPFGKCRGLECHWLTLVDLPSLFAIYQHLKDLIFEQFE